MLHFPLYLMNRKVVFFFLHFPFFIFSNTVKRDVEFPFYLNDRQEMLHFSFYFKIMTEKFSILVYTEFILARLCRKL
jgi:hypothetical protein